MSDPGARPAEARLRPEYGEYATPEEQRARIQQPAVTEALNRGVSPDALTDSAAPAAAPPVDVVAGAAASVRESPARTVDRLITAVLLGIGAVNVLFSVPSFLDLTATFTRTMETMGIPGAFTNTAGATQWGAVAAVSIVVGYVLTVFFSWQRIRARRRAWWVPLVGAAITYAIVVASLTVPMMADPAFQEYVRTMSS